MEQVESDGLGGKEGGIQNKGGGHGKGRRILRSLFRFPFPVKPFHLSRGGRQKDIMVNKEEYLPVKGSGRIQERMHI